MTAPALALRSLSYAYPGEHPILDIPQLDLAVGESLFLEGPSGSGKSTLLGLIAGVLTPASGRIELLGTDLAQLSVSARDRFRSDHLGIVFQQFNLLPYLSVHANVTLPARFSAARRQRIEASGRSPEAETQRLLEDLGLGSAADKLVGDLSVGQQQRVAVARALLGEPELVLADEPTSALDAAATDAFIELLLSTAVAATTVIFVSHDPALAQHFQRRLSLAELTQAATRQRQEA